MKRLNKGQLVFLPSDSTLLQFTEDTKPSYDTSTVKKFHNLSKPAHVLFMGYEKETPFCVVLYNGERWLATRKDIYPLEVNNGC